MKSNMEKIASAVLNFEGRCHKCSLEDVCACPPILKRLKHNIVSDQKHSVALEGAELRGTMEYSVVFCPHRDAEKGVIQAIHEWVSGYLVTP